ncbi:hypothetical protein HPB48_000323 [Haemaphysalis longicornis]|uniref:Endothelin-converting enzyme n=1 Tax=Haemaphysalis longicornis TaxID=44386 RepID=A0A9J6G231_HAELO|nr:hypothetical protein HPB48_000323 [Haemaphysalis longicornis]
MRPYIDNALARSWYQHKGMNEGGEWEARADCLRLTEQLVGRLSFEQFSLLTTDADDYGYVSSIRKEISEQLIRKITERTAWSRRSGRSPVEAADFRISFHEDSTNVAKESLDNLTLRNRSSLLKNWLDIVAAMTAVNATLRDRIPSTFVRDLVENARYSLFDNRTGTLSLPPLFAMLPVYRAQLSDSMKFGALGTLLGTASFQVFFFKVSNDQGARDEISRKLRCFADSSATNHSDPLELFNLAATVGVALDTLRARTKEDRRGLRNFNSHQTFFVLMCYLLCAPNASVDAVISETMCNEAVKNSESFAIAFRCAGDQPMNPPRKCRFF